MENNFLSKVKKAATKLIFPTIFALTFSMAGCSNMDTTNQDNYNANNYTEYYNDGDYIYDENFIKFINETANSVYNHYNISFGFNS